MPQIKPTDSGRYDRALFTNPEAGSILFNDGELLIEQHVDDFEQVAASVPIGPSGLKLLAHRMLALAVEMEAGGPAR